MTTSVKLHGVRKSFGDHEVLHGIDLTLAWSAAAAAAKAPCCACSPASTRPPPAASPLATAAARASPRASA
jgi:hypothetical protein